MKKIKLYFLIAAALFTGSAMATSYIPTAVHKVVADEILYTASGNATVSAGKNAKWIVIPSESYSSKTPLDLDGTKLSSSTSCLQVKADGGVFNGNKRVIHLLVTGVTGVMASGSADSNRGFQIGATEYTAGMSETSTMTVVAGSGSETNPVSYDGLDSKKTYIISVFAYNSDTYLYAIKLIAASVTEPICPSGLTITGDEQVYAGDKMTLTATLSAGNGEIAYQWYKDGTAAENAITGATNKSYIVESFSAADAGSYFCQASKADCEATINAEAFVVALKEIKNITCETDKYVVEVGTVIEDKMTITTPSVTLTFGEGGWNEVKNDTLAPAGYSALIAGKSDPKVSNNVPTTGCFYKFEVSKNATLNVAVKVNKDKNLFVVKGTESIGYTLAGTAYNAGSKITADTYDILSFAVEPETPYYVYCKSSKLGIYGFEIPGEDIGSAVEEAQVGAQAVKVIRDGQLLIIRDGKMYTAQGVELR